jgi:hypothetical protein
VRQLLEDELMNSFDVYRDGLQEIDRKTYNPRRSGKSSKVVTIEAVEATCSGASSNSPAYP